MFNKFAQRDREYPKVAIWKCRLVALPKVLLHIVPLCTSIFLVSINIIGYWLGTEISGIQGYNSAKLGGLQFAAKMHEITIMASLSTIVFTLVQMRLVSQKVAFGSVFSGLQFQTLSYLWSKELWEVIVSEWGQPHGKLFVVALLLATVLAPSVGPSSAVLMVPKLQDWPVGGTEFWLNATRDELWPLEVSDSGVDRSCAVTENSRQLYCPSSGLQAFLGGHVWGLRGLNFLSGGWGANEMVDTPTEVSLPGTHSSRILWEGYLQEELIIVAFCPSTVVADSLALAAMHWDYASRCAPLRPHFARRNSASFTITNLKQPITNVVCNNLNLTGGISDLLKGGIGFPVWDTYMHGANAFPKLDSSALANQVLEQLKKNSSRPDLFWLKLDQSVFGNNSIGVIATLPATSEQGQNSSKVLACTVDSHWMSLQYQINTTTSDAPWAVRADFNTFKSLRRSFIAALPRIHIDTKWAQYLNPSSSTKNITFFEELAVSAGIWSADGDTQTEQIEFSDYAVESILAGMITNGLSTVSFQSTGIQGTVPGSLDCYSGWVDPFFPRAPRGLGRAAGTPWNMTGVDTTNMTRFTMTVTANGYAYGVSGATSIVAIVILLVYCAMAIFHAVHVCWTGLSSSSWDSIPDLAALAIQSSPTEVLKNTGAGISTTAVFREPVQVLDVRRRLRLTFRDTEDDGVPVEKNETYE